MTYENPEVVELGLAEDLVLDDIGAPNTESAEPERVKVFSAAYIAAEE